ncbi:MAG: hypothetical protein KDE51_06645 [Anaerolineales bacterium]|nr:hypothetical protein [Anaerolineales bacterium]
MTHHQTDTRNFRFYDNREKYLLFVTTCSEKSAIAERISLELDLIKPTPPALRLFDAGMGDASVLTRVMRDLHCRYPTIPFLMVTKEISLEDVRLSLEKMADRFFEHPQTVFVVTNMKYSEAPTLTPGKKARPLKRWDIALKGHTAHNFEKQLQELQDVLADGWAVESSSVTGNPLYVNPSVLVIYRGDHQFALANVIPPEGPMRPDYDLILCAQPYRARSSAEKKVKYVLSPLAKALGKGGRMVVIQSTGYDPGMEIVRHIWPDENPFQTPRNDLIETMKQQLNDDQLLYSGYTSEKSLFQYHLHTMPDMVESNIGTSILLAAWNAAVYVAQIEDERVEKVMSSGRYLEATRKVLKQHGGLWFLDESFVVSRDR